MRVLNKLHFSKMELDVYRVCVFINLCDSTRLVLQAMEDDWNMTLDYEARVRRVEVSRLIRRRIAICSSNLGPTSRPVAPSRFSIASLSEFSGPIRTFRTASSAATRSHCLRST